MAAKEKTPQYKVRRGGVSAKTETPKAPKKSTKKNTSK